MKNILTHVFSLWTASRYILFIFIKSFGNIPNRLFSHDIKWLILMKYPVNLTWKEFSFEDTLPTEFRNNFKWLLKGLSFIINPVCSRLPGVAKSLSVALSIRALVCTRSVRCWGLSSLLVPWCTLCYNFCEQQKDTATTSQSKTRQDL